MKVRKIPARDAHVGMTFVEGSKEEFTLHKVTEVHIKPKLDYGLIQLGSGRIKIEFKLSDEPNIRITDEPNLP